MVNGNTEYYLKWEGYPRSENTWELVENLNCPELVASFEKSLMKNKAESRRRPSSPRRKPQKSQKVVPKEQKKTTGFERGLEPLKILGATKISGELMFLMKWVGTEQLETVPAEQANLRCPQMVIQFYAEHIVWHKLCNSQE
uniref:Umbrea n=1 Tax=Drosophila lucipennis TaxID=73156 RepID=R9QYW4_9MUSC|nr:Umbrea [Drosophila lucipennis]